jgi:hypothetical protein
LHQRYGEIRAQGYLAGSTLLYELERLTWAVHATAGGSSKLVAFVLASVFDQLARSQDGGDPVTADEGTRLHSLLDQALSNTIEALVRDDADVTVLLTRLVEAAASARRSS